MVKLVTGTNKDRFEPLLDSMFRDRKKIFVDRMKWTGSIVEGDRERDAFDTDQAVYLIAVDPQTGLHQGSMRYLPTTGPHLLKEVFPMLCEGELPVGEDIWEITRLCTRPDIKGEDARNVRRHLSIAMIEFAILYGASRLTMVTHMDYLSHLLAVGWECRPLGMPHEYVGQMLGAMEISITPATLQTVRTLFGGGARVPVLELEGVNKAA